MTARIFRTFSRILSGLLMLASATLFVYALFATVVFRPLQDNDYPDVVRLQPIAVAAGFALLLFLLYQLMKRTGFLAGNAGKGSAKVFSHKHPDKALPMALAFALLCCVFMIAVIHGLPTNDARMLDEVTQAFLAGDYSAITDGYIAVYPFQLSYCLISEGLTKLFGAGAYLPYQCLNILSILLSLLFLYDTAWELYGDLRVCRCFCLLCFGCLMLYTYSTFIYNDIWCLGPLFGGFLFLIRFLKYDKLREGLLAAILTALSFCIKSNGTIGAIAMGMCLVCAAGGYLQTGRKQCAGRCLIVLIFLLLSCLCLRQGVNALYETRSGSKIPGGVPAMAYFSMGMTETDGKFGWYNGDNVRFLNEAGGDSEAAAEAAKAAVEERFSDLAAHPKALLRFYGRKFLSQWGDPTKASIRESELTARHQELGSLAASLTLGSGAAVLQVLMHIFHLLLYFGCTIEFCTFLRGKEKLPAYLMLLPLFVFGGMLFHQIWEGSSRYTLRYELALMPFAAAGLVRLYRKTTGE